MQNPAKVSKKLQFLITVSKGVKTKDKKQNQQIVGTGALSPTSDSAVGQKIKGKMNNMPGSGNNLRGAMSGNNFVLSKQNYMRGYSPSKPLWK